MDMEFHYYITYLIVARAGFSPEESEIIAYSSQFVDNNIISYDISSGTSEHYKNYISQTPNVLKPQTKLFRIYPLFHFVPGGLLEGDSRKDGKLHYLNTTPDSENSRRMLRNALATKDLYRIGIALHAYSDTWSHQNFTGYFDEFNVFKKPIERAWALLRVFRLPVGHANAGHDPDMINKKWDDIRLLNQARNNNEIFLQAVERIFEELYNFRYQNYKVEVFQEESNDLLNDLQNAMELNSKQDRINRYKELSRKEEYGNREVVDYDMDKWMNDAVKENLYRLHTRRMHSILKFFMTNISSRFSFFTKYNWEDSENYLRTNWYNFQEAVKEHQRVASEILNETELSDLELDNW